MEWITDRKPDRSDWYIVTTKTPFGARYVDTLMFNARNRCWMDFDWDVKDSEVLAWAELPEPWEG